MQLKRMAEMSTNATVGSAGVKMGELTFDEKRELSTRINQLDADKLARVVQIIAERMPLGSHSTSEDIEIDIDSLDVVTLRKLQDFVKVSASSLLLLNLLVSSLLLLLVVVVVAVVVVVVYLSLAGMGVTECDALCR
jgi:hypothetical protein